MILLVVLGLLTMMALALLTYVLVAAQAKRTSRAASFVERRGDPPQALLHQAAMQVIRGTNEPTSVLGPHSLLEDLYGNDGVVGQIPFRPATSPPPDAFDGFAAATVTVLNGGPPALPISIPTILKQGTFLQIVVSPFGPDAAPGVYNVDDDNDMSTDEADEFGFGDDFRLADTDNFYNGRLFTMLDGPAAGQSTRIVGYTVNAGSTPPIATFTLLPFESMQAQTISAVLQWTTRGAPRPGDRFIINGRPFNGTGFGLNPATYATTKLLNLADASGRELALLPNPVFWPVNAALGGADEDYDAADYQNMLLGLRRVPATGSGFPANGVIPSLHRPDLANHWSIRQADWATNNDLRRQVILRPETTSDHPNFNGSNPGFNPITGPWDVDNDGDGVADSIWVDLGFPVQTAPDGRKYKPLFAIQCLDMDGKLNLNAHGNVTQLAYHDVMPDYLNPLGTPPAQLAAPWQLGQTDVLGPYAGTAGGLATRLPVGLGYGPAEINLHGLFGAAGTIPPTNADYARLLWGDSTLRLDGRYGERNRTFTTMPNTDRFARTPAAGLTFFDGLAFDPTTAFNPDWESMLQHFNSPGLALLSAAAAFNGPPYVNPDYHSFAVRTVYGTPYDFNGNGVVGIDFRGVPYWGAVNPSVNQRTGMGEAAERSASPYKLDLSWEARARTYAGTTFSSVDAPFTPEELERLLRFNDLDASSLPDRLVRLANATFETNANAIANRSLVTTEGWDLPSPNMNAIPETLLNEVFHTTDGIIDTTTGQLKAGRGLSILEILRARLKLAGFTGNFNTATRSLLTPELIAGLRLDVNRPLGNGIDDNGNGIVDEPLEADPLRNGKDDDGDGMVDEADEANKAAERYVAGLFSGVDPDGVNLTTAGVSFDHNNDGIFNANDTLARQLVAKQLYVLMWLLGDQPTGWSQEETAQYFAQIAVNIVDFRDRDSIMTPFAYDENPFAGTPDPWDATLVTPAGWTRPRNLVWGAERPELLITETLAFHDRRTEDTDQAGSSDEFVDPPPPSPRVPDTDFDQQRRPEGSLFVELYNPGNAYESPAGEFEPTAGGIGIALDKTAVDGTGTTPVWRLLIVKQADPAQPISDPDEGDSTSTMHLDPADVERSVYFTDAVPPTITDDGQDYHVPSAILPLPVVLPGRYAVIGPPSGHDPPSGVTGETTSIGKRTTPDPATTRAITLDPTAPIATATQVTVRNNTPGTPNANTHIHPAVAVVVDQPHRLSISEPLGGAADYDAIALASPEMSVYNPDPLVRQYVPPTDVPLDVQRGAEWAALTVTGTTSGFRVIHLQRLADPTQEWDALQNPYLTVDTMPVDLTAFNGESAGDNNVVGAVDMWSSRQRGDTAAKNSVPPINQNLWQIEPLASPGPRTQIADATHYFGFQLQHSLGFANDAYTNNQMEMYYEGANAAPVPTMAGVTSADYRGVPQAPHPWLTWLNRPFANQYELLNVPTVRSSQLLRVHGLGTGANTFDPTPTPTPRDEGLYLTGQPFPHLASFFATTNAGVSRPNLYHLLEYIHVPSRFAGTEDILQPANATAALSLSGDGNSAHPFHPPFNRVSRYREPGKININTIVDPVVWDAIRNGHSDGASLALPSWNAFVEARRGYTGAAGDMFALDTGTPPKPTSFSNPFRSFGGNNFVPLTSLQRTREIDTTLLRAKDAAPNEPLFGISSSTLRSVDPARNSYFRYLGLQKLGNTVTTRSNVYAVWITVGYFQVVETTMDQAHPDGYALDAELGSDTGEIKRHRAFYMIDRSIPVAFERGHDHNVENCILIKRFIE